jgi:hypothetical protein
MGKYPPPKKNGKCIPHGMQEAARLTTEVKIKMLKRRAIIVTKIGKNLFPSRL